MKQSTYANHSHQVVMEALQKAGAVMRSPIMLTANQFENEWYVSTGFMSTGVHIPKSEVDETEIRSIPEDLGYRFILNKVWHQKD